MSQSLNGRNLCNGTDVTYAAAGKSLVHCARSGTLGDQPVPIGIGTCSRACLSVLDMSLLWALVPLLSVQSDHSPPVCHQAGDLYIGFFLISFPVAGVMSVLNILSLTSLRNTPIKDEPLEEFGSRLLRKDWVKLRICLISVHTLEFELEWH